MVNLLLVRLKQKLKISKKWVFMKTLVSQSSSMCNHHKCTIKIQLILIFVERYLICLWFRYSAFVLPLCHCIHNYTILFHLVHMIRLNFLVFLI